MIKQKDGSFRRENPVITDKLEQEIALYKKTIARAIMLESLQDHPAWNGIKDILRDRLKTVENQIDKFAQVEHRQLDILMQDRRNLKDFINIVEDFTKSIPGFEIKLKQAEEQLRARKSPAEV